MINGKQIILRALEPSDADLMYQWENDVSIWPVSGTQVPFSKYTIEQFLNTSHNDIYTNKQLRLAIEKKPTNNQGPFTIGYIDLFDFEPAHLRAGVGILIGRTDQRRNGFALEALNLLSRYSFSVLHLHQLYCHIHASNEASIRLFSAAGFKLSGELEHWTLNNGTWENVFLMQKVNPI